MKTPLTILEKGDIYFFYRPRVDEGRVQDISEVGHFFFILRHHTTGIYRVVMVGKKKLPNPELHQVEFAFIPKVGSTLDEIHEYLDEEHYQTKTKGERKVSAAKPLGEGKYLLIKWGKVTHLLYSLEKSQRKQEVPHGIGVANEGSYIIQVKNPENPSDKGLSPEQRANYPQELKDRFKERHFIPLDPVDFLNYEGAEILIIGEKTKPTETWRSNLKSILNSFSHIDIAETVDLDQKQQQLEMLLAGEWS